MDDDIFDFLSRKREELEENKNFQEWYANNKLLNEDGEIVIAFHGSRRKIFEKIEEDKLNPNTHLLGGFYMTESIEDATENYSSSDGADYKNYLDYDVERLSSGYLDEEEIEKLLPELKNSNLKKEVIDEIIDVIKTANDTADYLASMPKRFGIDMERMSELNEYHPFDAGYTLDEPSDVFFDDKAKFTFSDICKMLSLTYKYENDGWVMPFIVKMDKPCFTGFDNEDTMFIISSMDSDEKRDYEESQAEEYEAYEYVMDLQRDIAFELDLKPSQLKEKFEYIVGYSEYSNVGEVFEKYIEALELLGIDEEKARQVCRDAFEEDDDVSQYISFDEDGDPENSEELYIPNYDIINGEEESEEYELGEEIRNAIQQHMSNFEFLEHIYDQEINYDRLLNVVKENLYEDEDYIEFTRAMSTVFDGVIMNAYKANRESWGNAFDMDYNARHYVLFNPNCVKSAIGNNGNYSLYNDNFVEKRVSDLKEKSGSALKRNVIEKHVDYMSKEWNSDINFELKSQDFFTKKTTLSTLDKENKIVYINKDNINSIESLEKAVTHEVVGHLGLNEIFDKNVEKTLLKIANSYKEDMKELNKNYPEYDIKTKSGKLRLAEEFLANRAEEKYPNDSFIQKAKKMLKKAYQSFKKSLGLKTKISDDVFELLEDSKNAVKNKNKRKRSMRH